MSWYSHLLVPSLTLLVKITAGAIVPVQAEEPSLVPIQRSILLKSRRIDLLWRSFSGGCCPTSHYNSNFWSSCGDLRGETTYGPTRTCTPRRDECITSTFWEYHHHNYRNRIRKYSVSANSSYGHNRRTHPPNSGAILCDDEVLHQASTLGRNPFVFVWSLLEN